MKILKSRVNDKKELYALTKSRERFKMSQAAGQLVVASYAIYEDLNHSTGEVVKLCAISDGTRTFCTNSPTFIDDFESIVEFIPEIEKLNVIQMESTKGRKFLACNAIF